MDKQLKFQEEDIIEEETGELVTIKNNTVNAIKEIVPLHEMVKMAEMLSKSTVIPVSFQNRMENILVALDLSNRMGISPFVIMQQLYIIQGKMVFSGQFIATIIQTNPKFRKVELVYVGEEGKDSYGAFVQAESVETGKMLKGTTVTIGMAKAEKWGAKWSTMSTQMLGYRSFTFFGRLYCPADLMGLYSNDEVEDFSKPTQKVSNPYEK